MVARCTVIVSILMIVISYNIYNEFIPPGSSQPALLKIMLSMNRLCDNIMKLLEHVGADYVHMRRVSMDIGTRYSNRDMDGVETEDTTIEGIKVRIYRPSGYTKTSRGPAMVYYHGGGWVLGSVDTHHAVTAYFTKHVNMPVISVDYRLSPEFSQKSGLDDCVAVTKHIINNALQYGVDPSRVAIAGDSAGGNFAAAIALVLRDEGFTPMPKVQLLIYPAVQGIDMMLPSYQQNKKGPFLNEHDLLWYNSMNHGKSRDYMPYYETNTHVSSDVRIAMANGVLNHDRDVFPKENKYAPYRRPNYESGDSEIWDHIKDSYLDPYHFPQMAMDHSDLPMAYIFTCQYDMIRDEGYLYAATLRDAGVDVTHYNSPIGWHGMINLVQDLSDSKYVMDKMCEYLRRRL